MCRVMFLIHVCWQIVPHLYTIIQVAARGLYCIAHLIGGDWHNVG